MPLRQRLSKVVTAFLEENPDIVLEVLKGWITERFADFAPEELVYAIEQDVNLWKETEADKGVTRYRKMAANWIKANPDLYRQYKSLITPMSVLEWLCEDTPHLASVVMTWPVENGVNKAYVWFAKNIEKIVSSIEGEATALS